MLFPLKKQPLYLHFWHTDQISVIGASFQWCREGALNIPRTSVRSHAEWQALTSRQEMKGDFWWAWRAFLVDKSSFRHPPAPTPWFFPWVAAALRHTRYSRRWREPVCSIYAHNWGEERWIWQWGATVRGSPYQNAVRIQKVQPFEPVGGQISVSLGG